MTSRPVRNGAGKTAGRWLAIAMFAAVFAYFGYSARTSERFAPSPAPGVVRVAPGERVPDLRLEDLRTGEVRDVMPPGRVRLINYWASWCGPCRREMPALQAFATAQRPNGVEVVGIALDDPDDARRFLRSTPVDFPLFVETPGPADSSEVLGNSRGILPYSVLIAADGRVVKAKYGAFDGVAELEDWTRTD